MQGKIDSSFTTEQRDLFASGLVAEIGVNAYAVWSAIKYFADYNTGHAWPGMRKLGEKLGLSAQTVMRAIESLERARMVRIVQGHSKRRGQTYIARERLAVRLGERVLCTIVVDYVPAQLRDNLKKIESALSTGSIDLEAFAEVEIIPGEGFEWDASRGVLKGRVAAREVPQRDSHAEEFERLGEAVLKAWGHKGPLLKK